jgi:dihydropteroate synthase
MQIKPIYLSSKSRILFYQTTYNLKPDIFWQGQYIFEISNITSKQSDILKSLNRNFSKLIDIYENVELDRLLVHFLNRSWIYYKIDSISNEDKELGEFFDQASLLFSYNSEPVWEINGKIFDFNQSPFIMGILNITPDSFSDGGQFISVNRAVEHALSMIDAGADIIDIGGESTRPGSDAVSMEDELQRVAPVIEAIRKHSDIPISIDTYKSVIADNAINAGANIINDISACIFDEQMPEIAKKYDTPIVLMHIKGMPKNMQLNPKYDDVFLEVYQFLLDRIKWIKSFDINKIIIDPGIGFGKRFEDNLLLLNNLDSLKFLASPLMVGASRKSFLGQILNKNVDQRLFGSLSVAVLSAIKGADIIRVHDVAETKDALKVMEAISIID